MKLNDFLPYIRVKDKINNNNIRLLIDTGANKNIIRAGIIPTTETKTNTTVNNIFGKQIINKKGKANLLGPNIPDQTYHELKFHNFFDGIIGSEFMSQTKSFIDFESNKITINKVAIPFKKYYPSRKYHCYTVTVETDKDGDWFVPSFQKLTKGNFIQPGLYASTDNKSTIKIISVHEKEPTIPKLKLKVNNFETLTPIPIDLNDALDRDIIDKLIRTKHLSEFEKKNELIDTLIKNHKVLLKNNEKLTTTTIIKHKIPTKDDNPVYSKTYRYPHHFRKDVEDQIQEMLDCGIITPSTSPYSFPIWVVPKKKDASGKQKIRLVINYRKINQKTINDKFPMPEIEDILDNLGKSQYFTTLDLKSGFHQIEMNPVDRAKTAFSTTQGHFEFTRMPFGLKNAPATFQRAMNNILSNYIGSICYVYVDDIIIIGHNLEDHLNNVCQVLERLA